MSSKNLINQHKFNTNTDKIGGVSLCEIVDKTQIVSIGEYRKKLNDTISTDEQIVKRLVYIESLMRNIIRSEISKFVKGKYE